MAKKVHRITIEHHGKEGFTIEKHHEQKDRGHYEMPETHIAKHHGEVMHHVHEAMKSHGASEKVEGEHECEMCGPNEEENE